MTSLQSTTYERAFDLLPPVAVDQGRLDGALFSVKPGQDQVAGGPAAVRGSSRQSR